MKRFFLAVAFCTSLIVVLSFFLFPQTQAAENPLLTLLNLPAPPPPNPQSPLPAPRPPEFFSKDKPPPDDGPIEDLIDYWRRQESHYRELGYNPKPSDKVIDRLLAEVEKDPEKVYLFLNSFRGSKKAADLVKDIYDQSPAGDEGEQNKRAALKRWLTYNSPYFSAELSRAAARASDANEYVTNQEDLLSLARVDWERARPIVDRLYGGNQKVSRVLAQWALYRNALDNGSLSDTERYREELKKVVEDKTATAGMRDLAFDALVKEKEWSGRDEWYYTLLADETLDDLRVGGSTYTGLTTIMYYSPDDRYVDRMIELVKSDNKVVRTAAVKNLLKRLDSKNPEVVKALLPWLENPRWIKDDSGRSQVVSALARVKVPESVPALIAALDEKGERVSYSYASNTIANMANTGSVVIANSNVTWNSSNSSANARPSRTETYYPLRSAAIVALGYQEDPRAAPALRRLLTEIDQPHEQMALVAAIAKSGGFTISEQVDALEHTARTAEILRSTSANSAANANAYSADYPSLHSVYGRLGASTDVRQLLGVYVAGAGGLSDVLVQAVIDRITTLERNDPQTSATMRKIVMRWPGTAVNSMLLRDLKNNKADSDVILRLLFDRANLREKQPADVFALRTGSPTAIGIAACLLDDKNDYDTILDGANDTAKTALMACARLLRAPLPVPKVAKSLQSKDQLLALAAERYLESEDSPEARRLVLSLHPNEAKILGATTAFYPGARNRPTSSPFHVALMSTVDPYRSVPELLYTAQYETERFTTTEARLQDEVKRDTELVGVYNWEENFIRVYKERAVLSWEQDPARYRERVLTKDEFENFKGLLLHYRADELPPFLSCVHENCASMQLVMLGRNGGRRVFVKSKPLPPLFAELDRMFEHLRRPPSAIRYWAAKDVPGLEVLFSDERMDAITVWKSGGDFRLLTADKVRRAEIDAEIRTFAENLAESDPAEPVDEYGDDPRISNEKARREREDLAWFDFSGGVLGAIVAQPPQAEYIQVKDNLTAETRDDQWKARAAGIEIRPSDSGLYKVSGGKATRIKTGSYSDVVITSNGRWAVATKYPEHGGGHLVRIDLLTNKEFVVNPGDDIPANRSIAYIPAMNRVLVGPYEESYYGYGHTEMGEGVDSPRFYWLLDPATGSLVPARGEARPLAQQTFRSLQPAASPFEFWAAVPKGGGTEVGIYNARTFSMKPLLTLPKIKFDSMDMWVDQTGGKVYFVYEGHLLAAPVKP